jgi:PadR family transcriptional regulator, regulatory protein PadR
MELPTFSSDARATGDCRCDGGQPKNFARPCLLLLLAEAPAHGYELMERLRPFGFEVNDPATVYKSLRQMEDEGLLSSFWDTSNRGPARRIYALTPDGHELLGAWAAALANSRDLLDYFMARHAQIDALVKEHGANSPVHPSSPEFGEARPATAAPRRQLRDAEESRAARRAMMSTALEDKEPPKPANRGVRS